MKSKKVNWPLWIGLCILVIILLLVILAPYISTGDPLEQDFQQRLLNPSKDHVLGTDHFGRDIWTRILYGGRITLPSAVISLLIAGIIGISLGLVAGFNPNSLIDTIIMRLVDIVLAFPFVVIALAVIGFWGPGMDKMLMIVVFTKWAAFTRITRSLTIEANQSLSVTASRLAGASKLAVCLREVLPNISMALLSRVISELANVITSLSSLSFFGLGSKPPTPEWGSMLSEGRQFMSMSPNMLVWPSLAIALVVLGLNLVNDGLRKKYTNYEMLAAWREG